MTSTLVRASRYIIFGDQNAMKKVSFWSAVRNSGENRIRQWVGLPQVGTRRATLSAWATQGIQQKIVKGLGLERAETLPAGFPVDVFECLDRYVQSRGGHMQIGDGLKVPQLKLNRRSAVFLPSMWICYIDFESESANFKALQAAEEQLEDALARECDQMLNLRICSRPARIEIDNPNPPMVKLIDKWAALRDMPPLNYALGIESTPTCNYLTTNRLDNANEFSGAWFGASGSGKTQGLISAVLSLCACTPPSASTDEAGLTVIIVDPKAIDFVPFAKLSHLKDGKVITDSALGAQAVLDVCQEMDARVKAGDPAAAQRRILLVVDELGDLLMSQKNSDELVNALTRLAQKGRAWGISMFLGSQRAVNESFPRSVQTNIPAMIVGRVRNQGEAAFASGLSGADCHKLPGRGAFQVFEPGAEAVRIQGLFVADSNKPTYAKEISYFVDDIRNKWSNVLVNAQPSAEKTSFSTDLTPFTVENTSKTYQEAPKSTDLQAMIKDAVRSVLLEMATVREATDEDSNSVEKALKANNLSILDTVSESLLCAFEDAYAADPTRFSQRKVRELIASYEGKRRSNPADEKAIHQAVISYMAQ